MGIIHGKSAIIVDLSIQLIGLVNYYCALLFAANTLTEFKSMGWVIQLGCIFFFFFSYLEPLKIKIYFLN